MPHGVVTPATSRIRTGIPGRSRGTPIGRLRRTAASGSGHDASASVWPAGSHAMNLDQVAEWSAVGYGLARPVACELLRSYTNDVYTVRSPDGRFILKVYGQGWRTGPEICYEVGLTRHLAARGLPIA